MYICIISHYLEQSHPKRAADGPPRVLRLADEVCESLQWLDVFLDGEERHQVAAVRRGDQDGKQPKGADHHSPWYRQWREIGTYRLTTDKILQMVDYNNCTWKLQVTKPTFGQSIWCEREIAHWVHYEGSIRRPIAPWANALTSELHLAPMIN